LTAWFIYICFPIFNLMRPNSSLYIIVFLFLNLFLTGCSKEKKVNYEVQKVNDNGLPILQPLQEKLPKLTAGYINEKKHKIAQFLIKCGMKMTM